jgi:hypothetical protein
VGLKLNGIHQFQAYADDVTLLGCNIDTTKIRTETLINVIKEAGLVVVQRKLSISSCLITCM